MEPLLRLAVVIAFLAFVVVAVIAVRWAYRRRLAAHAGRPARDLVERLGLPSGRPAVLFLTTPRCFDCYERQAPALAQLAERTAIEVREISAPSAPDLTKRFGIITVPSTVVIGADQLVRAVNVGFADSDTLYAQIS